MKIVKLDDGTFLVTTGEFTADLREISARCQLDGDTLKTVYSKSIIVLTPIRVKLGPISFAAISNLKPGESYEQKQ